MSAVAGNASGHEEAVRALFAGDVEKLRGIIESIGRRTFGHTCCGWLNLFDSQIRLTRVCRIDAITRVLRIRRVPSMQRRSRARFDFRDQFAVQDTILLVKNDDGTRGDAGERAIADRHAVGFHEVTAASSTR